MGRANRGTGSPAVVEGVMHHLRVCRDVEHLDKIHPGKVDIRIALHALLILHVQPIPPPRARHAPKSDEVIPLALGRVAVRLAVPVREDGRPAVGVSIRCERPTGGVLPRVIAWNRRDCVFNRTIYGNNEFGVS